MDTQPDTLAHAPASKPAHQRHTLDPFFAGDRLDLSALAEHLDALDDETRTAATCRLSAHQQALLFEAALAFLPLSLQFFVPEGTPPLTQVIHAGKNSLPFCTRFEKRFCLPGHGSEVLFGYNQNPRSLQPVTGPGYFVCYEIPRQEVLIDYTVVPAVDWTRPEGWPEVRLNSAGMSRYIYNGTQDTMRGVSKHVSIGRAARAGQWMDNWFVLCRRVFAREHPGGSMT
jgi:hypothetical protein